MNDMFLLPYKVRALDISLRSIPRNIEIIKAQGVWDISQYGEGVVVAVIDSGCESEHPALKENILDGYNFTEDDNSNPRIFNDYSGHGTHVAGIIAASQNEQGIIGVAPKAKLIILKVINRMQRGDVKNLKRAIQYAVNWRGANGEKVSVINMSLGSHKNDPELQNTIKVATKKGIIFVAASGNIGDGNPSTDEILYPGFYKDVLQIGAVDNELVITNFSNSNVNIDFVAPGKHVVSTHLNNSYAALSGTSMAAPHVSGAIALILNMIIPMSDREYVPSIVRSYLMLHAKSLGYPISAEGNGLIQLK